MRNLNRFLPRKRKNVPEASPRSTITHPTYEVCRNGWSRGHNARTVKMSPKPVIPRPPFCSKNHPNIMVDNDRETKGTKIFNHWPSRDDLWPPVYFFLTALIWPSCMFPFAYFGFGIRWCIVANWTGWPFRRKYMEMKMFIRFICFLLIHFSNLNKVMQC